MTNQVMTMGNPLRGTTYYVPRSNKVPNEAMKGSFEILTQRRILFLRGAIGIDECALMADMMAMATSSDAAIKLIVDSPGGSIAAAFQIYDTIRLLDVPVYTIGIACSSAAAFIFGAGSRRILLPHGQMMLHLPFGELKGEADLWEVRAKEMKKIKNRIIDALIECGAKKSKAEILDNIGVEHWMDAQETIDYGLADEIMTKESLKELLK